MTHLLNRNTKTHVEPSSAVSAAHHDNGVVLLHLGTGYLFAANQAGAWIWDALQRNQSQQQIADELGGRHDLSPAVAKRHVAAFISELAQHGLVQ